MIRNRFRGLAFASIVWITAGCSDDDSITEPIPGEEPACGRVLVVAVDVAFQTGGISVVDADSSFQVFGDLESIHPDATARFEGGSIYVVNRFGADNIQVIDPDAGFTSIRQFSVGAGSNPHDITTISESRAYVTRYGSASLLEIDPRDGSTRNEVSLTPLADGDGIPEMDRLFYQEPYLYVSIQRLDFSEFPPTPVPPSYLAVIDTRDNALIDVDPQTDGVQGIALKGVNPFAPMVWHEEESVLLVPCAGAFGALDGGVEKVSLDQRASTGWLVREADLGNDLLDFALHDGDRGYAIVTDPAWATSLIAFDPADGQLLDTIFATEGFGLSDLLVTSCGQLLLCDREYETPGLRVFDAATGDPVPGLTQPISTGLPPYELISLEEPSSIR